MKKNKFIVFLVFYLVSYLFVFNQSYCFGEAAIKDSNNKNMNVNSEEMKMGGAVAELNSKLANIETSINLKLDNLEKRSKNNELELKQFQFQKEDIQKEFKNLVEKMGDLNLLIIEYEKKQMNNSETLKSLSNNIDELKLRIDELEKRLDVTSFNKFEKDNKSYQDNKTKEESKVEKIITNKYLGAIAIFLAIFLNIL